MRHHLLGHLSLCTQFLTAKKIVRQVGRSLGSRRDYSRLLFSSVMPVTCEDREFSVLLCTLHSVYKVSKLFFIGQRWYLCRWHIQSLAVRTDEERKFELLSLLQGRGGQCSEPLLVSLRYHLVYVDGLKGS